ncbi:MAG TPA: hypothetical protein VF385_01345 [Patescibacteria group bacterium]
MSAEVKKVVNNRSCCSGWLLGLARLFHRAKPTTTESKNEVVGLIKSNIKGVARQSRSGQEVLIGTQDQDQYQITAKARLSIPSLRLGIDEQEWRDEAKQKQIKTAETMSKRPHKDLRGG